MANRVIEVVDQPIPAGAALPARVVPPSALAGATTAVLSATVDDPAADPPTDAALLLAVDASEDGGRSWFTVSWTWAGTSGAYRVEVPVRGRRIRLAGYADRACVLSAAVDLE